MSDRTERGVMPEPTTDERITVDACPKCGAREYDPPRVTCDACLVAHNGDNPFTTDSIEDEGGRQPRATERDLSWGADCDECETRMDAGRAQRVAASSPDGRLLCGSCRDEERMAELKSVVDALREENERLRELEAGDWMARYIGVCRQADALRARVEELEAQIDAALATTWTPDDEGGWGTEEDTLHPDRASALAALVPYWREWGDEAWDKAGRAEAALLSGGSQEPRPDTSNISTSPGGIASERQVEPDGLPNRSSYGPDAPPGEASRSLYSSSQEPRPEAICECCENPTTRPYVHPVEGIDLCAPCVAALPREEWTPKEEQT